MGSPGFPVPLPAGAHPLVIAAAAVAILILALSIAKFIDDSKELSVTTPAGTFVASKQTRALEWP